jgi:putative membrane protein insertion efficiency factor
MNVESTSGLGAPSVVVRALSVPIRLYQGVRGGRPSGCRYWPTCSTYALEALATHGAARGAWLATRRLLRCHPFAPTFGVDPVPDPTVTRPAPAAS